MSRQKTWLSLLFLRICVCLTSGSKVKNITLAVTRQIRSVAFPKGSGMGIFFALAIPVDIPDKSISFSFYFEANYPLPEIKDSNDFEGYFEKRSLDRRLIYEIIESKFESSGYPGRSCLLRTICEAAENPVIENGLVGDIFHIIFTPSSSRDENLPFEIKDLDGTDSCANQYNDCTISLLNLISYYY